jgi:hypothetical protein
MIRIRTSALLVLAGLIVIPAGPSFGQVKYLDEAGNTHYVQSDSMVPEQYRAKTKAVGPLPSVSTPGAQGGRPYSGPLYGVGGSSRMEQEEQQRARNMTNAAEQNAGQKRADDAKKDAYNRCVGSSSGGAAGSPSYGRASESCPR